MKFSVSKDKLLEGLSTVQNVVSTRTTLPILSNVLLQAIDGEIRLTTTDLDVGIRGSVEVKVERTGATTLPARRLLSIVRELPSSEIYFDVDTKNLASIRTEVLRSHLCLYHFGSQRAECDPRAGNLSGSLAK